MNKRSWIFFFSLVLIANIIGILLKDPWIDYLSKPLLVIAVTGYFYYQVRGISSPLKKWIFLALFFSWAGDILLMFQQQDAVFFLLGLSAFLVAHIFYIVFFHQVRIKEKIKGNAGLAAIVIVYYAVLIVLLSPHLGDMKLPVRIYGIVISFMFMLAMHMLFIKNGAAGKWMMIGALLFVVSDSTLAINKFYHPFPIAGTLIMLSYGLAQIFIAIGASRYIQFNHKG